MKKLIFLISSVFGIVASTFAQSPDSIKLVTKSFIEYNKQIVGRYKIYETSNIYISLKLDTATGAVTALQIGINENSSRMETSVSDAIITSGQNIVGRFELYPTGNMYNFILLDTIFGEAWQVQWSTKNEYRGRWRIW